MASVSFLVCNVRQQSNLTCALNGGGQLTLMQSARARYTTGQNLRALGNELAKLCGVFIIDAFNLVRAENADFLSSAIHVRTEGTLVFVSFHEKNLIPFRLTESK